MSIADWGPTRSGALTPLPGSGNAPQRPMHRLAAVRRQQGVSLRNVSRHLHLDMESIKLQEQETTDLLLSTLYAWQKVLDVPVSELLVDCDGPLSAPVLGRARMIKLMKTAAAIAEKAESPPVRRLVQMLLEQLVEIMPELADIGPWHAVGQRRGIEDLHLPTQEGPVEED